MPHNTALMGEFIFLLDILDIEKKQYTFKEISELLLVEEIKQDKFREFHGNMPYRIFTEKIPPDKDHLLKKFRQISKKGYKEAAQTLIEKRKKTFRNFLKNPEKNINEFLNVQYKPTKTWKQNWVEFVRDYVDFAAYCGLIPCYYKLPGEKSSEKDGYVISDDLIAYKKGDIDLSQILLRFKYSNSSINTRRYPQFNIRVRPFYLALKLLNELKDNGIEKIERRLLFGSVSSFRDENELNEAVHYAMNFIKKEGNVLSEQNSSGSVSREAGRVATGMVPFLIGLDLVEQTKDRGITFFRITKKGEKLLDSCAPNSIYFGEYVNGIFYSPLLAYLLRIFCDCSKKGIDAVNIKKIQSKVNVDTTLLNEILNEIKNIYPCPLKKVEKGVIYLNDFPHQYAVTPFVDFASLKEARFVLSGSIPLKIRKLEKLVLPPEEILNKLEKYALSDDGSKYEEVIEKALKQLPGIAKRLGQARGFARLSDVVWLVDVPIDGEFKKVLVIIEVKAGKAIKSFKETKEIDDIKNTILEFRQIFPELYGIWILIVDSNQVPSIERHGGYRGAGRYQLSFRDKLLRIHQSILTSFGKPVLVTAFDVYSFIEYYKYLYSNLHEMDTDVVHEQVEQFFMRGNLFFDDYRYIRVINDSKNIKQHLFA